jgi:hypothetical protein
MCCVQWLFAKRGVLLSNRSGGFAQVRRLNPEHAAIAWSPDETSSRSSFSGESGLSHAAKAFLKTDGVKGNFPPIQ